jgi:hypothetical protein
VQAVAAMRATSATRSTSVMGGQRISSDEAAERRPHAR